MTQFRLSLTKMTCRRRLLNQTTGLWHSGAQGEQTPAVRSEFPIALRARRGNRNSKRPPVRHSRAGGHPVFISRAQAEPGHGYCGRAAPSLPSQAEPGTEKMLFLSSVAARAAKSKSAMRVGLPAFDFAARSLS
jgi:hypothetical protein